MNYAPYNWGYDINSLEPSEISQSGANAVRMDWYWNNPDPDAFITSNVASDLLQADPQHNLILSAHAFWYSFANNDSATMAAKINAVFAHER